MRVYSSLRLSAALFGLVCAGLCPAAQPIAFPGAEGFGRFATGGRGGEVYVVTNLNDSGAGSLRAGVATRTAGVPRTVVFAVSGTIYLNSTLRITQGNLTIAGQTAPGDGICLANYPLDPSNSTNVVIRFLRSRLGDAADVENDAFSCRYATDVIVDHCSFSWSIDETATAYDNTRFTMQWCFVTESLRDSVHDKGAHGYGGIWGGLGASFHHNLIAHHDSRNPRFCGARFHGTDGEYCDVRNNVIYNWRGNSTYGGEPTDAGLPSHQNLINNYYKNGPATGTGAVRYRVLNPSANALSTTAPYGLFYVAGNHTTASSTVTADNWAGGVQGPTSAELAAMRVTAPFDMAPVVTQTATAAYPLVLAYGGCRMPARDPVDARIASEVAAGTVSYYGSKNGYAGIIDSQSDVGGYPVLASTPAPADTDRDGMPDAWESARGLDPANAADRNFTHADGYTNLEVYLNELAAPAFPAPVISAQPQSQTLAVGASFSVSVTATGPGPFSYQWYRGSTAIEGATTAGYLITATSPGDAGEYLVEVGNAYGTVRSFPATLVVLAQPPVITTPPAALTVAAGADATFSVFASGSPPFSYQWYRGTLALTGKTAATLVLPAVGAAAAGSYHVVVTNAYGSAVSTSATLTVSDRVTTTVFATDFSADQLQPATPNITSTATGWYVASSKNATTSAVGDDPATAGVVDPRLDLTMALTGSGVVEGAARVAIAPVSLAGEGDWLRVRATVATTNIRLVALGLFNAAAIAPRLGMNNGQLVNTLTTSATGGASGWTGYRAYLDGSAATPTAVLEGRPAQAGANNASQSLIVPGTSSSAPTTVAVVSASAAGVAYADGSAYTLTLVARRAAGGALALDYTIHAGADTTVAPLATVSSTVASASVLASAFDAVAVGYRNRDGNSVSRLRVTALSVVHERLAALPPDAYAGFLAENGLDPADANEGADDADPDGDGLPNALEFILGGVPVSAASAPRPVFGLAASTPDRAELVFTRRTDFETWFDLVAERSTDLVTWTSLAPGDGGVTLVAEPIDDTRERVTAGVPLDAARVFVRLRATAR